VAEPAPIPEAEARRTAAWMQSWGLLGDVDFEELVDVERQRVAHQA
jgi:hypothetical protein